ncbi:hypothetical protein AGMMS49579_01300 [Spirochaetia bacterium]|nr:hypothetical protein AGMMS49579_01300 [Spirochaetia bacterium]
MEQTVQQIILQKTKSSLGFPVMVPNHRIKDVISTLHAPNITDVIDIVYTNIMDYYKVNPKFNIWTNLSGTDGINKYPQVKLNNKFRNHSSYDPI